jgi:neopullulanase
MGSNNYFKMPFFQEVDRFKSIPWVQNTIWYQIFPERFENGDSANDNEGTLPWDATVHPKASDFFGGDIRGIINRLDYLEELGINGIYLCPIFEAPSNHKYDTVDYKKIDPHFGTEEDFRELVKKAHEKGIKIMLDAVFNHIGDQSPQFQDVLKNGEKSIYKDWFHIHSFPISATSTSIHSDVTNYDVFAYTRHMPKLNTANPEVVDYLLDISTYWIREFDIDAWRLDVANEVDHQFWKKFKAACDKEKEDFYIIGEIWTSAQSWLDGDEFTGVMNYAFSGAIPDYFAKKKITLTEMVHKLNHQLMLNRDQTNQMMFNLLDSHDAPRILSIAKKDKDLLKQMFAFLFLQNGTPDIYYGTEIGMFGENDPDNRKPMEWRTDYQDAELFKFFQKLIRFRKENAREISSGELVWKTVDEKNGLLSFSIGNTIGVFNSGSKPIQMMVDPLLSNLYENGSLNPSGFVYLDSNSAH